jgi:hypothetical protein
MRDLDELFAALAKSDFRAGFALNDIDRRYLLEHGRAKLRAQARTILQDRLAPARPRNDGKQTPTRGHPVFLAQHATAVCCRGCVETWHGIPQGRVLHPAEMEYLLDVLQRWLGEQVRAGTAEIPHRQQRLFDNLSEAW